MEPYSEDYEIDYTVKLAEDLSLMDLDGNNVTAADRELATAIEESLKSSKNRSTSSLLHGGLSGTRRGRETWPVCDVCDRSMLPGTRYMKVELWNQVVCRDHQLDLTPKCCSCTRFQPRNGNYISLSDGEGTQDRHLCSDCYATAILDTESLKPLVQNVLKFFQHLDMIIRERVPVYMVDRTEVRRQVGTSAGPPHPDSMVLGLTACNVDAANFIEKAWLQGRRVATQKKQVNCYQLNHTRAITVHVLYGFPKVMMGATLAHEFMHVWLRLKGVAPLEPSVEEGIAEVMGYEWLNWFERLDSEASFCTTEEAQFMRNLKMIYKHRVESSLLPNYGDGFRDAEWAVSHYGLSFVIDHIIRFGTIPTSAIGPKKKTRPIKF